MKPSIFWGLLSLPLVTMAGMVRIDAADPAILYQGRVDRTVASKPILGWSGTSATIRFEGTQCQAVLKSRRAWWRVEVDGVEVAPFASHSSASDTIYTLASGLPLGSHTVTLYKRTEVQYDRAILSAFLVDGTVSSPLTVPTRRLQFVGNSITCGYGALDSVNSNPFALETEDHSVTYAALTARALGAEEHAICWSGKGVYRNNDNSTTSTMPKLWEQATPVGTITPWNHGDWTPDAVVIDLGTNDFALAPEPDSAAFASAFLAFLLRIREVHPKARLVLLDGPMLSDYYPLYEDGNPVPSLTLIRAHMRALAKSMIDRGQTGITTLSLTPQVASVGYGADWHPNRKQHAINAKQLTSHLQKVLGWDTVRTSAIGVDRGTNASRGLRRSSGGWMWQGGSEGMRWSVLDVSGRTVAEGSGERIPETAMAAQGIRWATRSDLPGTWLLPNR